jgi:signal transduction histidine kinase/cbb3-type cytochrome oxidase subunit 3
MTFKILRKPTSRIFVLVLIGYLLITTYFTFWNYRRQSEQYEERSLFRLEGIANSLALQINGEVHYQVSTRYSLKDAILFNTQDTDYYQIHYILRRNYEANMLETPTYTMLFDSTKQAFDFIATSSDAPYFRHSYNSFHPILQERYTEGGKVPMYKDQFGMWLTAFAPIRDSRGNTVGIVMVDEKFDAFAIKARNSTLRNLAIALCIILPVIVLLTLGLRRLLFREERMKKRLEDAYNMNLKISDELAESNDKLKEIDTLRREMIANISHDLRTPLTNLSGYLETLFMRRHTITMDERERFLTIARSESSRLKKMIEDLFELSKLESNAITLNLEPFPIAELLQDVAAKYVMICAEKDIEIQTNLSENTPWVKADLKLVDRVFQNLLDNAVRHNAPSDGESRIRIDVKIIEPKLVIKISNTSEMIDPSVLPHLFDRYYKTSKSELSTGLGLAISQKIVNLHGCEIHVTSENGWTAFEFRLPLYK